MASELRLHPIEDRYTASDHGRTPPPRYSSTEERVEMLAGADVVENRDNLDDWEAGEHLVESNNRRSTPSTSHLFRLCGFIGLSWTIGLYSIYPSPTTVPMFVGSAFVLASWVMITWTRLLMDLAQRRQSVATIKARCSWRFRIGLGLASALVFWWIMITQFAGGELQPPVLRGDGERYFIAINLHNNEAILDNLINEMTLLLFHLGRHRVFLSIYESNSWDGTQAFLQGFNQTLSNLNVDHRILSVDNDPGAEWPYGTSPERIQFLAHARNMALEPLQSPNDSIRLPDWQTFTKVIFLNDIHFRWQDIVNLIGTRVVGKEDEEYDLACAMDFGSSGLYDTWVARDLCGTPFRAFWPFVKDKASRQAVRNETPFEVAACWNGAVVFDAKPVLYPFNSTLSDSGLSARGWKSVDDPSSPGSRMSPALTSPIHFRTSGVDACDHSECFLFSYDLHRLYHEQDRRPRILINPQVRVAYEKTWYHWNNVFLRRPIIRWWLGIWSHNIGYKLFDWPFERFGRRRDYCTWNGLDIPTDSGRCPPLPGSKERPWDE